MQIIPFSGAKLQQKKHICKKLPKNLFLEKDFLAYAPNQLRVAPRSMVIVVLPKSVYWYRIPDDLLQPISAF